MKNPFIENVLLDPSRILRLMICLAALVAMLWMPAVAAWIGVVLLDRLYLVKGRKKRCDEPQGVSQDKTQNQKQFIPIELQEKPMTQEEADRRARQWWSVSTADKPSGEEQVAEVLSEISCCDPSIHSCNLNEYKSLKLPTEAMVLNSLRNILREEGIAADLTPDNELLVSWGQDQDGLEVGCA